MKRLIVALAALGCLSAAPSAFAAPGDAISQTSSNWAGYAVSDATTVSTGTTDPTQTAPMQFTSVTATWKVPKVSCTTGKASYSAFWVGLGGYSTGAEGLEQTGTDSDCSDTGKGVYYAWYELVPAAAQHVKLKVQAGDTVTASVNVNGTDVLVQLKDRTRRTSFTRHLAMASPDLSSAEWIAEAPSTCSQLGNCRVLPLANFGSMTFSRIATIANGHGGTLTDTTWSAASISLVPGQTDRRFFGALNDSSPAGAMPAAASEDGRSFAVGWQADAGVPG